MSLIEFKETERPVAAAPDVVSARWPSWVWPSAVIGFLVFGLFAAWLGGVFKVKKPEGVIVLGNLPKDADVFVDGGKITFSWPGIGKPVEIRAVPGQHEIEVKKDGFTTFGKMVTFKAEGPEAVTVRLEPLVAAGVTTASIAGYNDAGKPLRDGPPVPPTAGNQVPRGYERRSGGTR